MGISDRAIIYPRTRAPTVALFTSIDPKLGDESELFSDIEK